MVCLFLPSTGSPKELNDLRIFFGFQHLVQEFECVF